ncbi:hypothetical protein LINPERHAP1_LOCUS24285 [Linum perenne]
MSRPQQGFQLLTVDDILLQLNLPKFTFVKQLFFTAPNPIPVCIQPVNMVMFTITRISVEPQIQEICYLEEASATELSQKEPLC